MNDKAPDWLVGTLIVIFIWLISLSAMLYQRIQIGHVQLEFNKAVADFTDAVVGRREKP